MLMKLQKSESSFERIRVLRVFQLHSLFSLKKNLEPTNLRVDLLALSLLTLETLRHKGFLRAFPSSGLRTSGFLRSSVLTQVI